MPVQKLYGSDFEKNVIDINLKIKVFMGLFSLVWEWHLSPPSPRIWFFLWASFLFQILLLWISRLVTYFSQISFGNSVLFCNHTIVNILKTYFQRNSKSTGNMVQHTFSGNTWNILEMYNSSARRRTVIYGQIYIKVCIYVHTIARVGINFSILKLLTITHILYRSLLCVWAKKCNSTKRFHYVGLSTYVHT